MHLHTKERGLRRNHHCRHLELGLPGSGTMRKVSHLGTLHGSEQANPGIPSKAGRSALVLASPRVFRPEQYPLTFTPQSPKELPKPKELD